MYLGFKDTTGTGGSGNGSGGGALLPLEVVSGLVKRVFPSAEYSMDYSRGLQEVASKLIIQLTDICLENQALIEEKKDLGVEDLVEGLSSLDLNKLKPTLKNESTIENFRSKRDSLFQINKGPSQHVKNWLQDNPNIDLNVCFGSASSFKRIVSCIKESGSQYEVNFEFGTDLITVQSLGPQNVSLLSVHLRASAFEFYECPRSVTLGLNLSALEQFLKSSSSKSDQLSLFHSSGSKHCTFVLEDSLQRVQFFNLRLKHFEIPFFRPESSPDKYPVEFSMPSQVFQKMFRDLKAMVKGDDVVMKVGKGIGVKGTTTAWSGWKNAGKGVRFWGEGAYGEVDLLIEEPLVKVLMAEGLEEKGVTVKFSISFLSRFAKSPLSESVVIKCGDDVALVCVYNLEEMGEVQYFLAPKTQ